MWILLVFIINYQTSGSQMSVEFDSKATCVAAAEEYKARVLLMEASNHPQIVVLCSKK